MIIVALILIFVPFFSMPPFIFSSYVQPVPLFLGWSILLYVLKLRLSVNILSSLVAFVFYILFLKFYVIGSSVTVLDFRVFIAYIFGFLQLLLFTSLFRQVFSRCVRGDMSLYFRVQKSFDISILVVATSVLLQLIKPIGYLLETIKPRSVVLNDSGIAQSYRGLSGLMPEPSYVGTCLGILLLSSFLLGYFRFICLEAKPLFAKSCPLLPLNFLDIKQYKCYFKLFYFSNFKYIALSIVAVFLSFSPASLLSFMLILCISSVPFFSRVLAGFVRHDFLRFLFIFSFLLLLFVFISITLFQQSRLSSVLSMAFSGDSLSLLLKDLSIADRYSSSALGVFSIFSYPFGSGLNGHGNIMSDCSNQIVQSLELLCGSKYTSLRNHNAFANLVIDGGVLSGCFVVFLLLTTSCLRRFIRSSFVEISLKISLSALPIVIPFLFVILPAPLGAPFLWIPFSISLVFLSELSRLFYVSST